MLAMRGSGKDGGVEVPGRGAPNEVEEWELKERGE